jgi:hypothetical protein
MMTPGEETAGPSEPAATAAKKKRRSQRRRRDAMPIKVRVDDQELDIITSNAAACGLTNAEFLRRLGKGLVPTSKLDQVHVRELCAVAGDLGRVGGLLKLWLVEHRAGTIPRTETKIADVDALLAEIQRIAAMIKAKVVEL